MLLLKLTLCTCCFVKGKRDCRRLLIFFNDTLQSRFPENVAAVEGVLLRHNRHNEAHDAIRLTLGVRFHLVYAHL